VTGERTSEELTKIGATQEVGKKKKREKSERRHTRYGPQEPVSSEWKSGGRRCTVEGFHRIGAASLLRASTPDGRVSNRDGEKALDGKPSSIWEGAKP